MRTFFSMALLGMVLVGNGLITGQEKKESNETKRKTDGNSVEVRFADDSTMKMVLLEQNIEIHTRFGKLTVPSSEIRRIDLGLRIPFETGKRIDIAVGRLGGKEFKGREEASAELLELGELSFPAVKRAAKAPDAEVARRAGEIMKTMLETIPIEKLRLKAQDTIVTTDFTAVGQIEPKVLKVRTPYLGEAQLRLPELRAIRWLGSDRSKRVTVDAAQHGQQQETWLDTGVEVTDGRNLRITATGTVDLWPIAPEVGKYTSGPEGMAGGGGVLILGPQGAAQRGQAFSAGALLGRVGDKGKVFVIGKKYEANVNEDGKLFLRIVASPWGNESSGAYEVRISQE